jgi:hypothetical protein
MGGGFTDPKMRALDAALKGGTSIRDYAHQKGTGSISDVEGQYATYLAAGDQSLDWATAKGRARQEIEGQGYRGKLGPKKGRVGAGSREEKAAEAAAATEKIAVKVADAVNESLEADIAKQANAYIRLLVNSTNMADTTSTIVTILKKFAADLPGGGSNSNSHIKPT